VVGSEGVLERYYGVSERVTNQGKVVGEEEVEDGRSRATWSAPSGHTGVGQEVQAGRIKPVLEGGSPRGGGGVGHGPGRAVGVKISEEHGGDVIINGPAEQAGEAVSGVRDVVVQVDEA
jgi:hypothetical protein